MGKIEWNVTQYPVSDIYGVCAECKKEIVRKTYNGYIDYKYWRDKLQKEYTHCPECAKRNAKPIANKSKWEKLLNGDYIAKCLNGDFLIWKYGNAYKWRYRDYGRESPNCIGFASTLEIAKKSCEKHGEWKGGINENC